jgi:hypothetical protein
MSYNKLRILVDAKEYFFGVEEFHSKPIPPNTILVISRRIRDDSLEVIPVFHHQYIAVDEGFTSSAWIFHPLIVDMNTYMLTCVIENDEERAKVVQYFKDTAETQRTEKEAQQDAPSNGG